MPRIDEATEVEIRELAHLGVEICSMVGSSDSGMNDVQIRKISNWVTRSDRYWARSSRQQASIV